MFGLTTLGSWPRGLISFVKLLPRIEVINDLLLGKMASLLRVLSKVPAGSPTRGVILKKLRGDAIKISCASISSDVALTIADYVEQKREKARLGGGQRRIDNQHKKVGIAQFSSCRQKPI